MNVVENFDSKDFKDTWTFAETIKSSSCIAVVYLFLVLKILPDYVKRRQPFDLKQVLIFYNVFQVLLSAYNVYLFAKYAFQYGLFPSLCWEEIDPTMMQSILIPVRCYFIAKHLDLLDTIFFVLRKKYNQVTFLHVYHHVIMQSWGWLYLFYFPTDIYLFVAMLNCFVHVIMYTYYALASLGPKYSKYTWWKKYLTAMQLTQFVMVLCYLQYYNKTSTCPWSNLMHWYGILSIAVFLLLFMNFYIQNLF